MTPNQPSSESPEAKPSEGKLQARDSESAIHRACTFCSGTGKVKMPFPSKGQIWAFCDIGGRQDRIKDVRPGLVGRFKISKKGKLQFLGDRGDNAKETMWVLWESGGSTITVDELLRNWIHVGAVQTDRRESPAQATEEYPSSAPKIPEKELPTPPRESNPSDMSGRKAGLSFEYLRKQNVRRCEAVFHPLVDWSPCDWATAVAGEVGEACNFVKKLRRLDGADNSIDTYQERKRIILEIGKELADAVIYIDLLAARLQLDLWEMVQIKFNEVSDRSGTQIKIHSDFPVETDAQQPPPPPAETSPSPSAAKTAEIKDKELPASSSELCDLTLEAWLTVRKSIGAMADGLWADGTLRDAWKAAWLAATASLAPELERLRKERDGFRKASDRTDNLYSHSLIERARLRDENATLEKERDALRSALDASNVELIALREQARKSKESPTQGNP